MGVVKRLNAHAYQQRREGFFFLATFCWKERIGMQLYLAFLRLTTRNTWKGCSCPPKCCQKYATLARVFAFDHANYWEGLLAKVSPKRAKPRAFLGRVARVSPKQAILSGVADLDHANPWEGLLVPAKLCEFASQSTVIFDAWRRTLDKIATSRVPAVLARVQSLDRTDNKHRVEIHVKSTERVKHIEYP